MQQNDDSNENRNQNDTSNGSVSIEDSAIETAMFEAAVEFRTLIRSDESRSESDAVQVITSQPQPGQNTLPSNSVELSSLNNQSAILTQFASTSSSPLSFVQSPHASSSQPNSQIASNPVNRESKSTESSVRSQSRCIDRSAFDWSAYENRAQMLQRLKEQRKFVDIQLIAEDGQSELVHSVVMSALGDRLSSCIFPQRDDPQTPSIQVPALGDHQLVAHVKQVRLNGVSGQVLRTLVECAYTGHIQSNVTFPVALPTSSTPLSSISCPSPSSSTNKQSPKQHTLLPMQHKQQLIWAILQTAEQFAIHDLIAACCTHLIYQLDVDNCIRLLQLGLRCGHRLRTAAWNYIRANFDRVLSECSDFVCLTLEQVDSLLEDDTLNIQAGEQLIWEAVRRWISFDVSKRAVHLRNLLTRIRFGRLPPNYIQDQMLSDPLMAQIVAQADAVTHSTTKHSGSRSPMQCDQTKSSVTTATAITKSSTKTFDLLNISGISSANSQMQQCVQLLQQMAAVRRNDCGQYRVDGRGLLVGLSPSLVRPRVPTEVLFAIGGWLEGVPTTLIETYDVRTDQWFEYSMYHQQPRAYHGIEVLNGLCYLIGGTNGTEILSSVHCFDPSSGRWYERANMYEQRCYVSTAQLNGLIYAMGGHNGLQRVRSVERYDPASNQWTQMPQMHLARSDASATVHDGRIYIAGGLNDQVMENSVEMYDPADNCWAFIQPMSSARTSFSLSAYGGSLYALGGNNGFERLATVERYDFSSRLWSPVEPMASRRSTFTACVLEDRLYVIGGYNGHTPINLVEAYDRRTARWTPVRSIKYDRSGLAVCVLKALNNASEYTYIGMTAKKMLKTNVPEEVTELAATDSSSSNTPGDSGTAPPSSVSATTISSVNHSSKDVSTPITLNALRPIRHRFGWRHRRRALTRNATSTNADSSLATNSVNTSAPANRSNSSTLRNNSLSRVISNGTPRLSGSGSSIRLGASPVPRRTTIDLSPNSNTTNLIRPPSSSIIIRSLSETTSPSNPSSTNNPLQNHNRPVQTNQSSNTDRPNENETVSGLDESSV